MTVSLSILIFLSLVIAVLPFNDEFCQMRQNVLRQELEVLQTTFNITDSSSSSTCTEYLDRIVKTIDEIDEESFLDQIKSEEFEEARRKYHEERDYIEASFIVAKLDLEDTFFINMREVTSKIEFTVQEIDRMYEAQKDVIKIHETRLETYDKCGNRSRQSLTTKLNSRNHKESNDPVILCNIPSQWFLDLKALVDTKVYSPEELLPTDDCNKRRRWFLSVNSIFQEAINQISDSYDIETYKATLQKRLIDRKREIDDIISEIKNDYERILKDEHDFLQKLNFELQKASFELEELKMQQIDELKLLAVELMECRRYSLADKMIDEITLKDFMKQIFIKSYENSQKLDKADNMMKFLAFIKNTCRMFEGYLTLYDIIITNKDQDSPTMIEIINQIRSLRLPGASCGIEYDHNNFLSSTLATDPIVDNILNSLADNIKTGQYSKVITFNYNYISTFQEVLSTLVSKSYTGSNLRYLLNFKDELYWLIHKYDVLNQLLDTKPPTSEGDKKMFKENVDKTEKILSLHHEHSDRLGALRDKMKRLGIE